MGTAAELIPSDADLDELRVIAAGCTACHLFENATQTVFGEGPDQAEVVLVGEQPGDREDREGAPFVGPAGRVLDDGLQEAGIDRSKAYVTNIVKHFKWRPAGKRRLHAKPNAEEIGACKPWLEAEVARLRPRLVVCLGATAAQGLLGRQFKVTQRRGEVLDSPEGWLVTATVHPSSILRSQDDDSRRAAFSAFVDDLKAAATVLDGRG